MMAMMMATMMTKTITKQNNCRNDTMATMAMEMTSMET